MQCSEIILAVRFCVDPFLQVLAILWMILRVFSAAESSHVITQNLEALELLFQSSKVQRTVAFSIEYLCDVYERTSRASLSEATALILVLGQIQQILLQL